MPQTLSRTLLLAGRSGLAHGALYGAAISWLHVRLNGLDSVLGSLSTLAFCVVVYGALAAIIAVAAATAWRLWRTWRSRSRPGHGSTREGAVWPGAYLWSLVYWVPALLYGLTYDQTWLVHPQGAWGMGLYLLIAASFIAALCAGLATVWSALIRRVAERALWARGAVGLAAAILILHFVTPIVTAGWGRRVEPPLRVAAGDVEVVGSATERPPVVVVGLDGLDPRVLDRLIAEGKMPNFERARSEGILSPLATLPDANSAVIWSSIYTGRKPEVHGVLDFYRVRLPSTGEGLFPVHRTFFKELADRLGFLGVTRQISVTRSSLRAFPYWEIADHFGLSIGVVDGYLCSYPALVPDTPGSYFLSYGLDSFAGLLDGKIADAKDLPLFVQPVDLLGPGRLPRAPDFDWQSQTLLELLRSHPQPRLVNLYAHEPDAVQHAHWREFEPDRYFGAHAAAGGGPIAEMYGRFDRFLGELRAAIDPRTALIVVSDHGHSPSLVHALDTQHRHGPPGVMLLVGGPFRRGGADAGAVDAPAVDATVYDVFPTVLHLLGLPVPEDAAGRVLVETLGPDFVSRWPVRTIPGYEGLWRPPTQRLERGAALDRLELEKLKKMGYL